MVTGYRTL